MKLRAAAAAGRARLSSSATLRVERQPRESTPLLRNPDNMSTSAQRGCASTPATASCRPSVAPGLRPGTNWMRTGTRPRFNASTPGGFASVLVGRRNGY